MNFQVLYNSGLYVCTTLGMTAGVAGVACGGFDDIALLWICPMAGTTIGLTSPVSIPALILGIPAGLYWKSREKK